MRKALGPGLAARLYALVTRAYPAAFREEYERELQMSFRDEIAEVRGAARARVAAGAAADVLMTAPRVHLDLLRQDLRYAWRTLTDRRQRAFAASAVLTLALGIGAATAIFSIVYAVMVAPLPYLDAERLVRVYETNSSRNITAFSTSVPNLESWKQQVTRMRLVAIKDAPVNLTDVEATHVSGLAVSADFFGVLGLPLVRGRSFTAAEDRRGGPKVAILGEGLWQRRYAGREDLLGQSILLDGIAHTVVGIAPRDVGFARDVDLWTPLAADAAAESRGDKQLAVLARLHDGVSIGEAQGELQAVAAGLAREFPEANGGWSARLEPVFEWIVGDDLPQRMRLLVIAVALLLLVACANVANLQMARAASRTAELGVRLALGASRARLLRQALTESLVLASTGAAGGLALAWVLVRGSRSVLPASMPRLEDVTLGRPVLAAALLATIAVAVVSALVPASMAGRADIRDALQHAGRPAAGAARAPVRHALVGLQLALSTTLVVGAALLLQSTWNMQRQPLGFSDPDRLLTASLTRSQSESSMDRDYAFYEAVLREVGTLPGVASAGLSSGVPLAPGNTGMSVGATPPAQGQVLSGVHASWRIVSPRYFETMTVPVVRGRIFDRATDATPPIVLSRTLARQLWPGGDDPIGRTVYLGNGRGLTVVGIVGDVRLTSIVRDPAPAMYFPTWEMPWPTMTLVVRTEGDPASLASAVRAAVTRVERTQALFDVQTMSAIVGRRIAEPRLNAVLLSAFAGLALVLASVGVGGVMAFAVTRRTSELAVRQALGASPRQAMRVVFWSGLKMCAAGIAAGILGALALGRALAGLLYGVAPRDVSTLAITVGALLVVAALACWLPARRATRINPMVALRDA